MKRLRRKLTYSNVVSTICLFLLIGGGTALAANELAKESVGTKQLKKGAVTPAKLSKAAKKTLTGPAGPQGAQGPTGPAGSPGPFPATLPVGQSLSGYMTIFGTGTTIASNSAAYLYPLASKPALHFIPKAAATPAGCTGNSTNPGASSGNLCIFVLSEENLSLSGPNGPQGNSDTDTRGFAVFAVGAASGQFGLKLRWVVTG